MDAWDLLKSIGVFAAGSTIVITALGFIARSAFLHFLSHDLETHKAKLAADNALALEQFKAQLRAAAFKHERLHEERLRVIAEVYERLVVADTAFRSFLAPLQVGSKEEHKKKILEALGKANDFLKYFDGKRIYFDASLCTLIDAMEEPFRRAVAEFAPYLMASDSTETAGLKWELARNQFMDKVPHLRAEIEKRVRDILGVLEPAARACT